MVESFTLEFAGFLVFLSKLQAEASSQSQRQSRSRAPRLHDITIQPTSNLISAHTPDLSTIRSFYAEGGQPLVIGGGLVFLALAFLCVGAYHFAIYWRISWICLLTGSLTYLFVLDIFVVIFMCRYTSLFPRPAHASR